MDKSTELCLTKQILRSILITHPNGIKTSQLIQEYYEIEGNYIRYHEFGYNSLIEFLKSIPDVLGVHHSVCDASNAIIYAVTDASTTHISRMIRSQKIVTKKRFKSTNNGYKCSFESMRMDMNVNVSEMIVDNQISKHHNRETMIKNIEMILRENSMPWFNSACLPHLYYNRFKERLPHNWIESIRDRFDITVTPATNGDITLIALKMFKNSLSSMPSSRTVEMNRKRIQMVAKHFYFNLP